MRKSPALEAYHVQKTKAASRGIEFRLTFDEWLRWWLAQGIDRNTQKLGKSARGLCMCRNNDSGAYELGNIYLATRQQNSRDSKVNFPPQGRKAGFARRIQTPDGVFASRDATAHHYGITPEAVGWRIANWQDWNYIDPDQNGKAIHTPQGIFPSQRAAAQALGVQVSTVQRRRATSPQEYYYV